MTIKHTSDLQDSRRKDEHKIRIILNTDYVLKQYFAYIGLNILFKFILFLFTL